MGIAHLDDAPARDRIAGHLQGRWTMAGGAAGCVNVGVRRIELPVGGWSTPPHEHGRDEETFRAGRRRPGAPRLPDATPGRGLLLPRSNKLAFGGIGRVARLERLN